MVERIEELCAKFETKPFAQVENLADGQVRAFFPWTLQNIFSGIAEAIARWILKIANVKPHVDIRIREMATPELLGAHKTLKSFGFISFW